MGILGGEGFSLPVVAEVEVVDAHIEFTETAKKAINDAMAKAESKSDANVKAQTKTDTKAKAGTESCVKVQPTADTYSFPGN